MIRYMLSRNKSSGASGSEKKALARDSRREGPLRGAFQTITKLLVRAITCLRVVGHAMREYDSVPLERAKLVVTPFRGCVTTRKRAVLIALFILQILRKGGCFVRRREGLGI